MATETPTEKETYDDHLHDPYPRVRTRREQANARSRSGALRTCPERLRRACRVPIAVEAYHGGLLRQLANAELDEDEEAETIDAIERDLARDPAFTAVEYRGNATFTVRYERRGNFYRHRYFTFVRHNSRVVSLGYVEEEETITVKGGAIPSSYHEQLTALGYQVNGELRITTDLDVKDHNATEVIRDDQGTTYLWIFRSIADPPARLVMG